MRKAIIKQAVIYILLKIAVLKNASCLPHAKDGKITQLIKPLRLLFLPGDLLNKLYYLHKYALMKSCELGTTGGRNWTQVQ